MGWILLLVIVSVVLFAVANASARPRKREDFASPAPPEPQPVLGPQWLPSPPPVRSSPPPAPQPPPAPRPKPVAAAPSKPSPKCEGDRFWVPAGQSVTVGERQIDGMIYAGSGLRPVSSHRGNVEPALLDPRKAVSWAHPDHQGAGMHYWPSYSEIDPSSRAAYLHWLSTGRKDPSAAVGYVFLFFYGIERRLLVDAQTSDAARGEIDGLLAEVERLLGIYGGNNSFRGYASSFLAMAGLLHRPIDPAALEPPRSWNGWQIPLSLKIALGAFVAQGRPIPPEWAWSWAAFSPEVYMPTPGERCPREFEELFKIRYAEAFQGEGLRLKPNKTPIRAEYRAASSSFSHTVSLTLESLPDITELKAPLGRLREIADRTCQDLDVYSRWVGRTGDTDSPAALALLPPELARGRQSEEGRRLAAWIEERLAGGDTALVAAADLLEHWPTKGEKLVRREAEMLGMFLERQEYGLEPDVRFGGPLPASGKVVLFRLGEDGAAEEPGAAYHAAALLLHLSVAVSAADGEVGRAEERHLLEHLERALHLSPAARVRLKAHLRWLAASPPGLTGLKKKIEPLPEAQRREIGQFLVTVAGADGHVSAEELKLLARIYPLLGLEAQSVYSDVHNLASAEAPPAAEPVTVLPPGERRDGFRIPPAPRPGGVLLDPRKIQAKLAESEDVAGLLEGIFAADEEAPRPAAAPQEPSGPPPVAGLDGVHSDFLRRLAQKGVWPRVEVERLAAGLGLLTDGALEVINEAAFERCGAPLLEGEETLEIDGQVLEEILA